ncbi:MAG TPA: SusC/RagA family TonB-linked outer membrane protein [Flavitalea sp.]|nr:SusC/RagA family TonB-linked outer membrane protein [Flavitalea sp.]
MIHCLPNLKFILPARAILKNRRLFFMICLTFLFTNLYAQTSITGRVMSGDTALSGVTVAVKGTATTTQTNDAGRYNLSAPGNAVLIFSYVGYAIQEVPVNNRTTVDVKMESSNQQLGDVVVVGYGTQKKATVTGAISTISSSDLLTTPATTTSGALVGKVQGITTRSPDSRPGRGVNIQIRNMGNPLFVIDGVPYTGGSTTTTAFGFAQGSGQDVFNTLGLEDIENITILKDASASIYGLRAANGVVLITTKRGKRESPTIDVSGYYGLQNFTRFPKPATAGEYVRAIVDAEQNAGRNPALLYSPEELAKWEAGTDSAYKSYDYYKMVTRPNVPQRYISASASGGTQRSTYYMRITHLDQDALLKDFSYKRTNLQANINTQLANRLQIGAQIGLRLEKTFNIGVPGLDDYFNPFLSIFSMWPTEAPYANNNPRYINQTHNVNANPATYKSDVTGWIEEVWHGMNINLNAQYDLPFGVVAKGTLSYNYQNEDFDGMEYTYPAYIYSNGVYQDRAPGSTVPYGNQNPWREKHKRNVINRYAQFQLSYNKVLGDHSISAVAAYERSDYDNAYFVVHSVPSNNYVSLMNFSEQDLLTDTWGVEARAGYIGRVNYSYKQKYLLELLGRYDGSYLYAPEQRWGFFSGISGGWRISQEPFFRNFTAITDLKLRASYGETGSEAGINAFDYLPGYNYLSGSSIFNGTYVIGLRPRGLPITQLSWVMNRTKNIGIDIAMFNNKITAQFDVFERRRTGLPAGKYDVLLPSEVGYLLPNENLNEDASRGIEGIVNYNGQVGQLNYSIGVNASFARLRSLNTYKPRFGNSYDEFRVSAEDRWSGVSGTGNDNAFGYHVIGRFQSMEEIDNYPVNVDGQGNRTMLPGDFIYEDANSDGIINALDQRPIGYPRGQNPFLSFGSVINARFKGFSLSIVLAGASMQSFLRDVELKNPFQNTGNSPHYMFDDRWHRQDPYDPKSAWVAGTYPATRRDNTSHMNFQFNDFWLTNIKYLRLRNIELGYDLPKTLLKRVGTSRVRIYVNATNLFTIDNVSDLEIDPEITSSGGLVYPQQKLLTFGFNVSF